MNHNVNISGNGFAKGVMSHRMRTTGLNKEKFPAFNVTVALLLGLSSEFQTSQGYMVKPCLKKKKLKLIY